MARMMARYMRRSRLFTGLQIEHARRDAGERVQDPHGHVQVRGVRRQPFVPHPDRKGQDGGGR
jgi:hypothetical protein